MLPRGRVAWGAVALACAAMACGPPPGDDAGTRVALDADAIWADYVAQIEDHLEAERVPGMAVAVVLDGRLAYAEGLGRIRAAQGSGAVEVNTVFRWGSISKVHTALAALVLQEGGALTLDDRLWDWVPEFEPRTDGFSAADMTLRQLLDHTAGVPDDLPWACTSDDAFLEAWFAGPYPWPIWSSPGAVWNYSNAGYNLAGVALERASGRAFPDLIEDEILEPLGMRTATFRAEQAVGTSHAVGHERDGVDDETPRLYPMEDYDCARGRPASALHGSVLDLARLAEALLDDGRGVLPPLARSGLGEGVSTGLWGDGAHRYGLGLYRLPHKGVEVWAHDGIVAGFEAQLLLAPEHGLAVVVASNATWARTGGIAWLGLERFLGLSPTAEAHPITYSPVEALDAWTGRYAQPWELGPEHTWGGIEVWRGPQQLWVELPGVSEALPLEQVDGGVFAYTLEGGRHTLRFDTDPQGGRWLVQRRWVAHEVALGDAAGVPAP